MNPASVDIKDMLKDDSSLELTFGTNLFIGREPSSPDNCVTVFDTPGAPPLLTFARGENYYYPSVLIRVRNRSYQDGWTLINDIKVLLHAKNHETWNETNYGIIICSGDPAFFDWDETGRARFIANFNIQRGG